MSDSETALARLVDEAAIRDVTARFGDLIMRADFEGFRDVWADDAEWVIGKPADVRAQGTDDIVSLLRNLWNGNEYFVHFAVQGPIRIDGDEASATCVCHEAASGPDGRFYRTNGVWTDRLRRTENGWVFTSRSYAYLWIDTSPFSGQTFPLVAAE